jgi:AcrR family transcriptional regulator
MLPDAPAPVKAGRREQNKRDKAQRIRAAATAVFRRKGYRDATMQEVAQRAGVATGTLFLYAASKRDLLIAMANEDLDRLTAEAIARDPSPAPLIEQLLELFRPRYEYWAADARLALAVLGEVQELQPGDAAPGSSMARYARHREVMVDHIARLIEAKKRAREVRADVAAGTAAALIMLIYSSAARVWLRESQHVRRPDVDAGLARLRALLDVTFAGLVPARRRAR